MRWSGINGHKQVVIILIIYQIYTREKTKLRISTKTVGWAGGDGWFWMDSRETRQGDAVKQGLLPLILSLERGLG